jgi:hypothetical protein
MSVERTHVGLDVHAHEVVGAAIDSETGELFRRRLGSEPGGGAGVAAEPARSGRGGIRGRPDWVHAGSCA